MACEPVEWNLPTWSMEKELPTTCRNLRVKHISSVDINDNRLGELGELGETGWDIYIIQVCVFGCLLAECY